MKSIYIYIYQILNDMLRTVHNSLNTLIFPIQYWYLVLYRILIPIPYISFSYFFCRSTR